MDVSRVERISSGMQCDARACSYLNIPCVSVYSIEIGFPSSSSGRLMSKTWRIDAMFMNREERARCRPGHILFVRNSVVNNDGRCKD